MFNQCGGSNKYFYYGYPQRTLELEEGNTYIFSYPSAHPFALSTTSDGTHGGGSEYTTGVTRDTGANTLTYVVPTGAPTLYYYCTSHSGMGGQANTPAPVDNNLQLQQPIKVKITSAMLNMLPLMMFYLVQVVLVFHYQMAA